MKSRASLVVLAVLALVGAPRPIQGEGSSATSHETSSPEGGTKESGEREILYWRAPMDPSYTSDEPGKSPMGMDLVPVYEDEVESEAPGTIRIDPATVQNIGVKTVTVERKVLSRHIRTIGRIDYDERKVRSISPKIGGWVEEQRVSFTGQVVEKGEPLLEIYSPELVSAQEEYLLALRYRDRLEKSSLDEGDVGGESMVRSAEARLRYWDITDRQIRTLRKSGTPTRTMTLHAPFRGIVLEKHVLEGGHVRPGEKLYALADLSTVWVYADVYEYEAPWLGTGHEATMTLSYDPGARYQGEVVYVYPYLEKKTRTLKVRMEFENSRDLALKPDMWADVEIHSDVSRDALAVPVQAVLRTGKRDVVLIALGEGRFAPRTVRLGAQSGGEYEVLGGLKAGERVVTSAQFLINSESSLQSALQKMTGEDQGKPDTAPADHDGHAGDSTPGPAGHEGH